MTLETKLRGVLEWYDGCLVCDETLENVRRELAPLGFTARFDGDVIVAYRLPRVTMPKKQTMRRTQQRLQEQPAA